MASGEFHGQWSMVEWLLATTDAPRLELYIIGFHTVDVDEKSVK